MKVAGGILTGIAIAASLACTSIRVLAVDLTAPDSSPSLPSITPSLKLDPEQSTRSSFFIVKQSRPRAGLVGGISDLKTGLTSDQVTYGLSVSTQIGARSKLSSLMFTTSPQEQRRITNRFNFDDAAKQSQFPVQGKSSSMMVQNAEASFGKVTVKLGYQNVSKDFNSFAALQDANVAPKEVLQQLEKEKGMKRTNLALQYGADTNKLSFGNVSDGKGEVSTRALGYAGKNFGVSIYKRSVDKEFARLGDLSAQEKTDMALAVRQQFDANATVAQVTDAERTAVANENGIDRSNIRANYKAGSVDTGVQVLNISDGAGDVQRNTINFGVKDFRITWMQQSISDKFGKLPLLSPVEQAQFGNEHGMNRTMLNATGKLGSSNIGMSFSNVSDGEGSVTKQSLSLTNKKLDLKANFQEISPDFKRSMDLADSDKKQLAEESGYKKTDLTANIKLSDSISMENYVLRMNNGGEGLEKSQMRNKITFNPNPGTKITLFRDSYSFRSGQGIISSYMHQNFGLDKKIGSMQFSGFRDTNSVTGSDGQERTTTTTSLHLETDKNKRNWLAMDSRSVDITGGGSENTRAWTFQSRPVGNLLLKSSMMNISRSQGPDESSSSNSLDWQIGKNLRATADISTRKVENSGVTDSSSYTLSGNIADKALGMKDIKFSAQMSEESFNGKTSKQNNRINLSAQALGGSASMEVSHGQASDGSPTKRQGFVFVSNRDPKRWLHFDIGYAVRDLGPGDAFLVRRYNLDMRLNSKTNLVYSYFSYIEKPDGTVDSKGGSVIRLATALNKRLNLTAEYGTSDDYLQRSTGAKLGIGIVGHLSNGAAIEFYYGQDELTGASGKVTDEIYRIKYDRYVSSDNYLSFSGVLKTHDDKNPATNDKSDVEARLDFRRLFH